MKFEIYCDESGWEALVDKNAHRFIGIGSLWLPAENRIDLKESVNDIKRKFGVLGELKWNKVSPSSLDLYIDVLNYFFSASYLRYRILIIPSHEVDNIRFHQGDAELGFYKFYYQLLKSWISDFNEYKIFTDLKKNKNTGRLTELEKLLDNSNLFSDITGVQGLPSNQSVGIQLADILTGLLLAKFNAKTTSAAKLELTAHFDNYIWKNNIQPEAKGDEKVTIVQVNLEGGW